jgi:hypothetical protein
MTGRKNMLVIALGALCIGVVFYALGRQHSHVYFLPSWIPQSDYQLGIFGSLGDCLPTFIHVYAFILLTAIIAAPSIDKIIPICVAWFTLDSMLEIAQIDMIAKWISIHIPGWFTGIPFLENTENYFLLGTFDIHDLLSIAAGSVAAYLTVHITQEDLSIEKRN